MSKLPYLSSPRTRGCSGDDRGFADFKAVVPAHAGLFRHPGSRKTLTNASSPRTRGCSDPATAPIVREIVVPAHAGLFPARHRSLSARKVVPAHAGLFR